MGDKIKSNVQPVIVFGGLRVFNLWVKWGEQQRRKNIAGLGVSYWYLWMGIGFGDI